VLPVIALSTSFHMIRFADSRVRPMWRQDTSGRSSEAFATARPSEYDFRAASAKRPLELGRVVDEGTLLGEGALEDVNRAVAGAFGSQSRLAAMSATIGRVFVGLKTEIRRGR
jgi:hypothetical protein